VIYIYKMFKEDDDRLYNMAVKELVISPVTGQNGTYHIKNGQVHLGYTVIPVFGFSHSTHAWNILH
jgi:hypothetical protein